MSDRLTTTTLREFIVKHFSLEGVRTLCEDCQVDYEELGQQAKEPLVRELIRYLANQGKVPELVQLVQTKCSAPFMERFGLINLDSIAILPRDTRPPSFESAADKRQQHNREVVLKLVKDFWIEGVLENSVHGMAIIALGMEEHKEAVEYPWDMVLQISGQERFLPSGTKIVEIFNRVEQSLLILGEPGSGKTTMLLELAREKIDKAEIDPDLPIPVIFNLSSWLNPKQPLAEWVIREFKLKYNIPEKISRPWIEQDALLLLLDGLDEVAQEYREICVKAINEFRQEHLIPLAICSRTTDYRALAIKLRLQSAIQLQPLTYEQVQAYLTRTGNELQAVQQAIQYDVTLKELSQSPLMLSIMTLAYRGLPVKELSGFTSLESRYQHLFETYVKQMFLRKGVNKDYSPEQTLHWLTWLAQQMKQHNQTEFLLEQMQRTWLATAGQRALFDWGGRLAGGTAFVLVGAGGYIAGVGLDFATGGEPFRIAADLLRALGVGAAGGIAFVLVGMLRPNLAAVLAVSLATLLVLAIGGLMLGLIPGLVFALVFGLPGALAGLALTKQGAIGTTERLIWSPTKAGLGLVMGLVIGLVAGINFFQDRLADGLSIGLPIGLTLVPVLGLTYSQVLEPTMTPYQGLHRSGQNALRVGSTVLLINLLLGLLLGIAVGGLVYGLAAGVTIGVVIGLAAGLSKGGAAYLQHGVLRLILYQNGYIPRDLIRFLNYATERIFLRQVGGRFIFIHRLLLDYFAVRETDGKDKL